MYIGFIANIFKEIFEIKSVSMYSKLQHILLQLIFLYTNILNIYFDENLRSLGIINLVVTMTLEKRTELHEIRIENL